MNWKLHVKPNGSFIEIFDQAGKIIMSRPFLGWVTRLAEDPHIQPKFQLEKNESVSQDKETGDLLFKYL